MRNKRPALLFQKDNPNLCKNDVSAGQFRGKNHRDEPENRAEAPGYHTEHSPSGTRGIGEDSDSICTVTAGSSYLFREPPNDSPRRERSPQGNAAAASAASRMVRTELPGPPPLLPAGISLGDAPGERDPRPWGGSAPRR